MKTERWFEQNIPWGFFYSVISVLSWERYNTWVSIVLLILVDVEHVASCRVNLQRQVFLAPDDLNLSLFPFSAR